MKKVFPLKGHIQHYLWGGKTFIPDLLGIRAGDDRFAEYWLGAHSNAPSQVVIDDTNVPLDQFIKRNPFEVLGQKIGKEFGRLPFLFKVLDVHHMLSIQVHPSKNEAVRGFKRENELKIPLTAPNRNYKDDNHKPEVMVALGEFWLLHGFLPRIELLEVLEKHTAFKSLVPIFNEKGYKGLYQYVMELPSLESDKILKPLIDGILPLFKENKLLKSSPDYWAAKAVLEADSTGHLDKGIFSIYFFNILKVNKGEALFQDAGVPHAYLEGQNMELMANSDNVLRGGLTQKHVDVPELLKHVIFEETKPEILQGKTSENLLEKVYSTPAPDFELSALTLGEEDAYEREATSVEIYILMEGKAEVTENNESLILKRGDSFMVVSGAKFRISSLERAILYKATTP